MSPVTHCSQSIQTGDHQQTYFHNLTHVSHRRFYLLFNLPQPLPHFLFLFLFLYFFLSLILLVTSIQAMPHNSSLSRGFCFPAQHTSSFWRRCGRPLLEADFHNPTDFSRDLTLSISGISAPTCIIYSSSSLKPYAEKNIYSSNP